MLNHVIFGDTYSNVMVTKQLITFRCEHVRKDDKYYRIAFDENMIEKKSQNEIIRTFIISFFVILR